MPSASHHLRRCIGCNLRIFGRAWTTERTLAFVPVWTFASILRWPNDLTFSLFALAVLLTPLIILLIGVRQETRRVLAQAHVEDQIRARMQRLFVEESSAPEVH